MPTLRWGILSTARIGTVKVIPAIQRADGCEVAAIASRDLPRAQAEAARLGIPCAYGSYEDLLADPTIDAIYNPLPNHLHLPWSLAALAAGKHVLCEKPIGLNAAEAEQLADAAAAQPHLKVMEAFMYRFHPQWLLARQLTVEGAIGRLRSIHTFFSYYNDNAANIRNVAEFGGGGLMDIGCYPISLSRWLFDREPVRVLGRVEIDPRFQVDHLASALLDFGEGEATFTCSTQLAPYQRVHVFGEQGRIELEIPFNAPPDRPCRVWLQQQGETRVIDTPPADQYTLQAEAFARAVVADAPVPTPLSDAVANMRVIERIFASARSGGWA